MTFTYTTQGLVTAVGIGLLIGIVRERSHPRETHAAGVRTHALAALAAAIGAGLGTPVLVVVLGVASALAVSAYLRTSERDPGLTGEFALLLSVLLGVLATTEPALAAALAVVTAALLFLKAPLRRLAREVITEREVGDALLLAASALVVLPLLPTVPVDPWGVLVPARLWRLVVLVMAVGMMGHVVQRLAGRRFGLAVAGFFGGFASSTAAVAGFGHLARSAPTRRAATVSAALLANLASLLLLGAVLAAVDEAALRAGLPLLAGAGGVLLVAGVLGLRRAARDDESPDGPTPRAFNVSHAVLLGALMAALLLVSAWLRQWLGGAGAIAAAVLVSLVELQAAAASLAELAQGHALSEAELRWGLVALWAASGSAKSFLAFATGGAAYGRGVAAGLAGSVLAAAGLALAAA
jgi:uncharacterized membrane protein (DUF4010 family)